MKVSPPAVSQIATEECYFRTRPLNCWAPYISRPHSSNGCRPAHTPADMMHMLIVCHLCPSDTLGALVPPCCPAEKRPAAFGGTCNSRSSLDLLFHFPSNKAKFLFKAAAHKDPQKQQQIVVVVFHEFIIFAKSLFFGFSAAAPTAIFMTQ